MIDIKVRQYSDELKKLGVQHEILEHPQFTNDADIYAYYKTDASSGFATILLMADTKFFALIRRDDTLIDFQKLRKDLNVKTLRVATVEEFTTLTGLEPGQAHVVLPVSETLLDRKLFEKPYQMGGSGSHTVTMRYVSEDLKRIPNSRIVDVTTIKDVIQRGQVHVKGKRLLSGITPSGDGSLHIGNYLGAVRQFIELAKTNESYLMVADLHALTTIQDKAKLSHNIETLVLNELALLKGFLTKEEFDRIVFFRQSDVPMHTECQSILNNVTPLGLLKRAHAYKDKLQKDVMEDDINVGLFSYPMLMAADILLYQPDVVPVGKDQKQHIEITRDIAQRFNAVYQKQVFKLPEPYIPEEVAVVLGTDGQRKMSKSLGNLISIFESDDVIRKQVNGTFTDPTRTHATDPGHIEGNMVFAYLDFFGESETVAELKEKYTQGRVSDVEVKAYLFDSLLRFFGPARAAYEELRQNPALVQAILSRGQAKATDIAVRTMQSVRDAAGITTQYSFFRYPAMHAGNAISIDEFARVEIRVGKVLEARNKEGSDKLIRLTVDIAEEKPRIIFTGVRTFGYVPEDFAGKQFFFITNLAYRKMMGEESQGMILAVDNADGLKPLFISGEGMPVGARIR